MPKSFEEYGHLFGKLSHRASLRNYEEHEPIYMYHVSPKPLGRGESEKIVTLRPKVICSSEDEAAHLNRICVAPSVEQCLIAITGGDTFSQNFYVYRTVRTVKKSIIPYGVQDAAITQERWLSRARQFKMVAKIPRDIGAIYNPSVTACVHIDWSSRGAIEDIHNQRTELKRLRQFMKRYSNELFFDERDKLLYEQQRKLKLRLNRNDIKRVCSSSSS